MQAHSKQSDCAFSQDITHGAVPQPKFSFLTNQQQTDSFKRKRQGRGSPQVKPFACLPALCKYLGVLTQTFTESASKVSLTTCVCPSRVLLNRRFLAKQVIRSGTEPARRRRPSSAPCVLSVTMALFSLSHLLKLCGNR